MAATTPMTIRIRRTFLLAAALLLTTQAHAQPSAASRQTARTLLLEGRELLESGDARAALAKFRAAHEIMGVPTTGLDVAKALEALGQLIEARAMAYEVTQMPLPPNAPAAFTNAQAAGEQAVEALDSRIPSLMLRIEGAPREAVRVTVDGETIPAAALTMALARNPGSHEIVMTAPGYRTVRRSVVLKDGVLAAVEVPIVLERDIDITTKVDATTKTEAGRSKALIYAGVGVAGALAAVGVGTRIASWVVYGKANAIDPTVCGQKDRLPQCSADFNKYERTRVALNFTSLFTLLGAGVVGGATAAYGLTAGKTPAKGPTTGFVTFGPGRAEVVVMGVW
ncbi:hypothetical protein [Polyangium mundeleinium]|uniref:PEGA domain-containing protein n=1 Tax=Polyangium mundeleinium TaxID=2995306 RepID=A0ABT5EH68_9BACT|nr:hypothetical protein [Polyangium mundeleinium]MDC0740699.1 hypothetical protein [Polyangium mundeleinium]